VVSRRELIARGAAIGGAALVGRSLEAGDRLRPSAGRHGKTAMEDHASCFAYVGCRTTRERNARGAGISVFAVDDGTGPWTPIQVVGDLINPSYLALDRGQRFLYTVHGDSSEVSAFGIDVMSGRLSFVNRQSTRGKNPVHLTVDPGNRFLIVANHITAGEYTSSLAVLERRDDGSIGQLVDHVPLAGPPGPHRVEQPFAKPHQVQYDPAGRFIAVPDKGLDLVATYRLDGSGRLRPAAPPVVAREGSGPRHVAFHPARPFAYVINELNSTVTAYHFDSRTGALTPFQVLSCLPDTFTGNSRASEIELSPDGRFVYASNRGYDSIAVFEVDQQTGRLGVAGFQDSRGRTPRFFALGPGGGLFAANEDSDTIVAFSVNGATGLLGDARIVAGTGSPTCLVFLRP
jgi:6-phosphogluconolactonase (cycloisomerase 2 family)